MQEARDGHLLAVMHAEEAPGLSEGASLAPDSGASAHLNEGWFPGVALAGFGIDAFLAEQSISDFFRGVARRVGYGGGSNVVGSTVSFAPGVLDKRRVTFGKAEKNRVIMWASSLLTVFTTGKETETVTRVLSKSLEEEREVALFQSRR